MRRDASIIVVNSWIAGQAAKWGTATPLSRWGWPARPQDIVAAARSSRWEIIARARLHFDPRCLAVVLWGILRGVRSIYVVSIPDIALFMPVLKSLFPSLRMVTWSHLPERDPKIIKAMNSCDHIFCLNDIALERLHELGFEAKTSQPLWGSAPSYYQEEPLMSPNWQINLFGSTYRDVETARQAIRDGQFSVVTMRSLWEHNTEHDPEARVSFLEDQSLRFTDDSHKTLIQAIAMSNVTYIPTFDGEECGVGTTTLIESLLVGTPVIVIRESTIAKRLLALPGVYSYTAGSPESLVEATRLALSDFPTPQSRWRIREGAADALDGTALEKAIKVHLCV